CEIYAEKAVEDFARTPAFMETSPAFKMQSLIAVAEYSSPPVHDGKTISVSEHHCIRMITQLHGLNFSVANGQKFADNNEPEHSEIAVRAALVKLDETEKDFCEIIQPDLH